MIIKFTNNRRGDEENSVRINFDKIVSWKAKYSHEIFFRFEGSFTDSILFNSSSLRDTALEKIDHFIRNENDMNKINEIYVGDLESIRD